MNLKYKTVRQIKSSLILKQNKESIVLRMQPSFPQNSRQRPLQKSMFLPHPQQYVNRANQIDYQYQDIMKRSSINPDTNKFNSFQFNQPNIQSQTPVHQFNPNSNPVLNFSANTRYKEIPRPSQFEQAPQSPINSELAIQQLQQKINSLSQMVESHEDILKRNNFLGAKEKSMIESQIQQIENRLRQNVVPTIISRETKEIYEHIFNFKLQIKTLKEQVNQVNDKIKNQLESLVNSNKKSASTVNSVEKIDKSEELSSEIGANFISLEKKLMQIQKESKNKNEELKNLILLQIEKSNFLCQSGKASSSIGGISSSKIRSSTIQSTFSPIMIEYRELFCVKGSNHANSLVGRAGISSPRSKQDKQFLINSTTYFIDRQGYLLDGQNRYIVDAQGHQIKLEQTHLALLKEHHVLN